LIEKENNQN